MLRLAVLTATASLVAIAAARGDEVHHSTFAASAVGVWALKAENCAAADKSNVTIAADADLAAAILESKRFRVQIGCRLFERPIAACIPRQENRPFRRNLDVCEADFPIRFLGLRRGG